MDIGETDSPPELEWYLQSFKNRGMKRLMIFLIVFILLIIGLFTRQFTAPPLGESLWLKQYSIFGASFYLVDILTWSIVSFISVMILLLMVILLKRVRMEKRDEISKELLVKYQVLLMDYIQSVEPEGEKRNIKRLTNSRFKKQLLINQIVDIAKNLRGENLGKLQDLYFELGLHKRTFRKVRWGNWSNKIKGIKELCSLSLTHQRERIMKYAHSKNDFLRMEAQTALVDLSRFEEDPQPFKFLDDLVHPFSTWEQIALYQVMLDRDIPAPNFLNWMFSDNPTVILFALRMTREYHQVANAEWVKNLAWHNDEEVRRLTYEVMGDLKMVSELKEVRKLFKNETIHNQREMIRSMRKAADPAFFNFLKRVIDSEEDAEILVEGVRAINDAEGGKEILDKMLKDTYKNYNIIIKHVKDRKIV